ncbi:hypothetical protein SCHPADRAFT_853762 [Schizopora paradoxa]|uniref:Uncharacterized protein n=1 Tax=Schizopora paradoxa TaxID=27342 RepID=A0A0H2RSX8_9AGAM|nr:hypothetical protein SCHPADRAFT_853762 [Schizopora paradoxa]
MADKQDEDGHRTKRFKHQTYNQQLKDVHLAPALSRANAEELSEEDGSLFHARLSHWTQLNLSPTFLAFSKNVFPLAQSLPLLVHHWKEVLEIWLGHIETADDEARKALFDLLQNLILDLRSTLAPSYATILKSLLRFLPRNISPDSLTPLIETLATLFKHSLPLPLEDDYSGVDLTWEDLCSTIVKCKSEIQRAVGEVWPGVLRRLKKDARCRMVRKMLSTGDGDDVADFISWCLVSTCKGIANTLHSSTASVVLECVRFHSTDDNTPTRSATICRRLLTALVHHCSNADQFTELAEALLVNIEGLPKEGGWSLELQRSLQLFSIITSVRQGSRCLPNHHSRVLIVFTQLTVESDECLSCLDTIVASFVAQSSDLTVWLRSCRRVLDHVWAAGSKATALALTGALLECNWDGFKQFALPLFKKHALTILRDQDRQLSLQTLRILSRVGEAKLLDDIDEETKTGLGAWANNFLTDFSLSESTVLAFRELSNIIPTVQSRRIAFALASLLQRLVPSTEDTSASFNETWANEGWVVGRILRLLVRVPADWLPLGFGMPELIEKLILGYAWSEFVMDSVSEYVKKRYSDAPVAANQLQPSTVTVLVENLKSHLQHVRLSSLNILNCALSPYSSNETVKRCITAEEVPLSVQGVRERVLRIGRLSQFVRDDDVTAAEICVTWLLGQVKVNLRPIWSPSGEALASFAERFPETLWPIVVKEIASFKEGKEASHPLWADESLTDSSDAETKEEERTWRDPSAFKLRSHIRNWTSNDSCVSAIVKDQCDHGRFNPVSFEAQLLSAMAGFSSLVEKHGRDVVPLFLEIVSSESDMKSSRARIVNWLTLFSNFSNPKALPNASSVHEVYIRYLSHPDRALQTIALSCELSIKSPGLTSHADLCRSLLDNAKWRETLTFLDVNSFSPKDRAEVVPVIIRILYGMMLERKGRGHGMGKRAALLGALGGCSDEELSLLTELMTAPFKDLAGLIDEGGIWKQSEINVAAPEKQQVGFLTLLGDALKTLASRTMKDWPRLLAVTVSLGGNAQNKLGSAVTDGEDEAQSEENEAEEMEEEQEGGSALLRSVRLLSLKRITDFFRLTSEFDFTPYISETYRMLITPRLALLDQENTQAPSALLDLMDVWTYRRQTASFLGKYDTRTLTKIYDCLIATNVKPSVLTRIFDIIERLLAYSVDDEELSTLVIKPYIGRLLDNFAILIQRSSTSSIAADSLLQREISILTDLSPYVTDRKQAVDFLSLLVPQLRKSHKLIPEKMKVNILEIVTNLLPSLPGLHETDSTLYMKIFDTLSSLLQQLRGRNSRIGLISAFDELARLNQTLVPLTSTLSSLNAFSTKRIDEPDFDKRLAAVGELTVDRCNAMTPMEWRPILHNMLYCIQDENELSIRSNATSIIKRFLDVLSKTSDDDLRSCFSKLLFPGLKHCLRSKSDAVRLEIISVLGHGVSVCENIPTLNEMRPLLGSGDEEVNFFNNICHVQVHRRIRSILRLGEYCDDPGFGANILKDIFLPIVTYFILSAPTTDHHLVNEAISTLGRIAKHLPWSTYHALVQQFLKLSTGQSASERVFTRTLLTILDNFHFTLEESSVTEIDQEVEDEEALTSGKETATQSTNSKVHEIVARRLLPSLLKHLEQRDEMEDSNRILIAVGVTKVALYLPEDSRRAQIDKLLSVTSQIFRSKSQETRDITRETLCKIAVYLGPSYLPKVIQCVRDALQRGPHLHVLAFVVHALLVHVTSEDGNPFAGNLDDCVRDVAHISSEVIFGKSGKDVESEGFKTKMKEVRSSSKKGIDSFSILGRVITPSAIPNLLYPIKAIMHETESSRSMQLVDDVLRAISLGINSNPNFGPSDILSLCHTLITQNARFFQQHERKKPRKGLAKVVNDVIVQNKRKPSTDEDHYAHTSWRFVCFGLDLFSTAYKRNRFDFSDNGVLSRLQPMVNVIGNTLYSSNGSITAHGLKATGQICRCPLPNIDKSLPVFARQTLEIVRQTGSTESEMAQTALKTLAAMMRECPSLNMKEKDLTFLLELVTPDLQEPDRQSTAFAILKAIIARKFVVAEIYDMMDKVAEIMVTSQSTQVRELCRGVLLQFLLDYPQGKGRLKQHFAFLVKNLSYVFEAGRMSVMELLNATILKFSDAIIEEYSDMIFIGLVMVIANDESPKCRETSAQLLKSLIRRMKEEQRRTVLSHVHVWASQEGNVALARVSSQLYGLFIDTLKAECLPYVVTMLADVNKKVNDAAQQMDEGDSEQGPSGSSTEPVNAQWQVSYQALLVLSKIPQTFPDLFAKHDQIPWAAVSSLLLYPHAWVRTASCRLLGSLFSITPVASPSEELSEDFPLSLHGMQEVAWSLTTQLKSEHLDETLSLQIVKNLFYVGKCFYAKATEEQGDQEMEDDSNSSDGEDDDEEKVDEGRTSVDKNNLLPWLFSRLSYQARSAYVVRMNRKGNLENWSRQPSAIFRWFAAMASHMDESHLRRYLPHVLSPLYRILEDTTIRDPQMDTLKSLATEVQDLVRNKAGSDAFASAHNKIRQKVQEVRMERRTARSLLNVLNPRAAFKRKEHKHAQSKENKKRKQREFADRKIRTKFSKRRKTD